MIKPLDLRAGTGIQVVESAEQLQALTEQEDWKGKAYTLQSVVDGTVEYVTHCVCKDGRILWTCSFECEMEEAGKSGAGWKAMRSAMRPFAPPQNFLSDCEKILAPLKFSGPCNIDYKLSTAGEVRILEINPRFGGSLFLPDVVSRLKGALSCIVDNANAPQEAPETVSGTHRGIAVDQDAAGSHHRARARPARQDSLRGRTASRSTTRRWRGRSPRCAATSPPARYRQRVSPWYAPNVSPIRGAR